MDWSFGFEQGLGLEVPTSVCLKQRGRMWDAMWCVEKRVEVFRRRAGNKTHRKEDEKEAIQERLV